MSHPLYDVNDADFDPWMLHEWHKLASTLATRAQTWGFSLENA